MTTPRKRPRQARELVLDRPFWMHHLTGGLQVLLGSNRQCLLLAPEVGMRAFTLRAGASVDSAFKSYNGKIRVVGRSYASNVEEMNEPVTGPFVLRACAPNNQCLAHVMLHHWRGMAHALSLESRGPDALLIDRAANHIGIAVRRLEKLSIAYRSALSSIELPEHKPDTKSMFSNKYAQNMGIEYRALINELYGLRDALSLVFFRLYFKRTDGFKTKKLKLLLLADGGPTASLMAASMFAEAGGDLLIERMSLYRSVAQHCLGSNSPIFGDVYAVASANGILGDLRWLVYPLYDDIERLRSIEQGATAGIIDRPDRAEAERFIGKDDHLDALDFCCECLVRLLTIASGIADGLGIEPKMHMITDADILQAEITDENGTRRVKRDPTTGKLVEVGPEELN